jgi:uncharacterized protein (TIGR02466 family)
MPDGDFSRGADVHFRAGVQHQLKERFAEAIAEYEVALSLEPSHAPVLNNHGGALMKLAEQASGQELRRRHQKAAETSLRAATNFAPSTLDAYYNLGILLREKLGGALLEQSSERHLGADRSYQRAAEAAESFGVAARLQPGDGALWERRADAFLAMGAVEDGRLPNDRVEERGVAAYKKALESLERVVALQPTQSGAYAKLAIAAHGVGLHRDPGVLGPLLLAMRYLQHAASDASRTVHLSGVEIADDHGGGGGTDKVCEHDATMATGVASCAPAASAQMERCEVHYSGMELPGQRVSAAHRGSGGEGACKVRAISWRSKAARLGETHPLSATQSAAGVDRTMGLAMGTGSSRLLAAFATPVFVYRLHRHYATDLHAALLPELLALQRRSSSVHHSNRGGWQSAAGLLSGSSLSVPLATLRTHALEAAEHFVRRLHTASRTKSPTLTFRPSIRLSLLNAWANVNNAGDSNLFHDHPQASLSGVYFVDDGTQGQQQRLRTRRCGADGGNGSIELIDPRYSLRMHRPPKQFEPPCEQIAAPTSSLRAGYLFEYSPPMQFAPTPGSFLLFPAWLMHRVRPHKLPRARVSVSFNVWIGDEEGGLGATQRLFDGAFAL